MSVLHVVFRVAGGEYVLPALDVMQMDSFTGATPVPGAAPYVEGIMHVRARVVPVVDLRARFGLPPAPRSLDSRVVVAEIGGRTVALLADSAREVVKLESDQFQAPPSVMTTEGSTGFVKAVAYVQKRLFLLLDFEKVVGEEPPNVSER